jgi:hypothetical protein
MELLRAESKSAPSDKMFYSCGPLSVKWQSGKIKEMPIYAANWSNSITPWRSLMINDAW